MAGARKRRGEEERRDRHLGNDFPWILLPKRPYLGGGPGSFLLFPYFIFQSRNSRPCASLLLPALSLSLSLSPPLHHHTKKSMARNRGKEEGRRGEQSIYADLRFARRRLRFPRLEVIITYIRQLTRVHTLPFPPSATPRSPATLARWNCSSSSGYNIAPPPSTARRGYGKNPLLFYIVSASPSGRSPPLPLDFPRRFSLRARS